MLDEEATMVPNSAPMTTATARSTTLPRKIKAENLDDTHVCWF